MPQLPSGRHIAAQFDKRLINYIEKADYDCVPWIMGITKPADLIQWLKVIYLTPAVPTDDVSDTQFTSHSVPRAVELIAEDSGIRLSEWGKFTNGWSDEDKAAMQEFRDTRLTALMILPMFSTVQKLQEWLVNSTDELTKTMVLWWQHGCHPAQENRWKIDDPVTFDLYDMCAVLIRYMELTKQNEPGGQQLNRTIRLWIFADNLIKRFPDLHMHKTEDVIQQAAI